jgi:hypothetical protein
MAADDGVRGVVAEAPAGGPPAPSAAVSRSCVCIGSPCLRHCVHGASIGAAGSFEWGRGGGRRHAG